MFHPPLYGLKINQQLLSHLFSPYEDNADAHLKRSMMGREVVMAVTEGKLDFGTWEQIFYGEFDEMRDKRVLVKIIRASPF